MIMKIKQHSKHDQLTKLLITGTHDELRELALDILYAIDAGTSKTMVGTTHIKIRSTK